MNGLLSQAKPYMEAASNAQQLQVLLGQSAGAPPPAPTSDVPNNLPQLSQQLADQAKAEEMQADAERKKRRMGLLGVS